MCILADRTARNNNQLSGGTEGGSISNPCTCPAGKVDGETQTDVVVVDLGMRMRSSYSDEEDDDGRDRQSHWKRIKTRSESHSDAAGERFRFMGHSRDNSHSHDRSLGGGGGGGKRLLLLPTQKGNAADQHQQQRQASRRMILEKIAGSRHLSSYDDDDAGERRRTGSIIKGWDVSSMGRGGHHQHSDGGTNINTTCKKKETHYSRAVMKRKHTEAASSSVDDGNRRRISSSEHHNPRVLMYHGGSMMMTTREENNKHMARRHFVDTAATQGYETRVSSSCSSGVADVGRFNGEDQIHFVENFGHSDDDGADDDGFVSIRGEKARIITQDLRETLNARQRRSESLKRENLNNRVECVVDDLLLKRGPPKGGGIQLRSNGTVTQGSLVKKFPSNCDRSRRPVDDDCQGFAKTTGSGSLGLERSKGDMESDERHRKEKGRTRWAEKERDDLEKENLAKAAAEVKSVTVVDYSHKFTVAKAPATIPEKPVEADPHRLCQRQKQIDYGKNTLGYERYTEAIPRYMRTKAHPRTPDIRQVCSKRSWDGQIRKWRRLLHEYDPPKGEDEEDPDQLFVPTRRQDSLKGSTTDDSIMDTQSEGDKLVEDADLKIYDGWSDEEC